MNQIFLFKQDYISKTMMLKKKKKQTASRYGVNYIIHINI